MPLSQIRPRRAQYHYLFFPLALPISTEARPGASASTLVNRLSAWVPLSISISRTIKFPFCAQRLGEVRVDDQTIGD